MIAKPKEAGAIPHWVPHFAPKPNGQERKKRYQVFQRDDYRCQDCGRDMLADLDALLHITVDHVRPRCCGGTNAYENLVTACRTCNMLKDNVVVETLDEARAIIAQRREMVADKYRHDFAEVGKSLSRGASLDQITNEVAMSSAAVISREAKLIGEMIALLESKARTLTDAIQAATSPEEPAAKELPAEDIPLDLAAMERTAEATLLGANDEDERDEWSQDVDERPTRIKSDVVAQAEQMLINGLPHAEVVWKLNLEPHVVELIAGELSGKYRTRSGPQPNHSQVEFKELATV